MKIAYMWSGQGSQYPGMGKELYDNYRIVKDVFDEADDSLGFKISEICFTENDKLDNTEYTQPAVLTLGIACYKLLESANVIKPDYGLGLSLGEYSALVASGVLNFRETVELVRKRGKFMNDSVSQGSGAMVAIIGLSRELVEMSCREAFHIGFVFPANYNMPGQIVISGEKEAVYLAADIALKKGAKKTIKLNVSGPFHTILLKSASARLFEELHKININEFDFPVITNLTGNAIAGRDTVISTLTSQIMCPVLWEDSIKTLAELDTKHFIELGPGRNLSLFVKKINKDLKAYNIENIKSFDKTIEVFM